MDGRGTAQQYIYTTHTAPITPPPPKPQTPKTNQATTRAFFALDRTHCHPGVRVDPDDGFLTATLDSGHAAAALSGGYGSGKALVLGTRGFRQVWRWSDWIIGLGSVLCCVVLCVGFWGWWFVVEWRTDPRYIYQRYRPT